MGNDACFVLHGCGTLPRSMNSYEITVLLPGTEDKNILDRLEKEIKEAGGIIGKNGEWGKRELAYPIKKQTEGVYYFMEVSLPADKTAEINRMLDNSEQVLRHLIVRTKSKVQNPKSKTGKSGKIKKSKKVTK